MSQQLRQLKTRIRSIEGTWKVTRAMEMVSMSKYKAIESPLSMSRSYFKKLESIAFNLIRSGEEEMAHPFIKPSLNESQGKWGLVVVTSETGLCGIYNDHVLRAADRFIAAHPGRSFQLYLMGRKASGHYKRRNAVIERIFPALHGKLRSDFHMPVYQAVSEDFLKGKVSEVHVAHTLFVNAMKHEPVVKKLLSVEVPPAEHNGDFMLETGSGSGISDVLAMYVSNKLRLMCMESFASEYSARMVAMRGAKDNAKELMGDLVLMRNKLRQATITREVIEIISSSEALKG